MNSREVKTLIKENSGRPYYVYGLFFPGGNCFYVGKGSGDRVLQHRKHSHSEAVNAIFKRLGKKSPRKYCLWCVDGQRNEMLNCPSIDCELWPYRKSKTERPIKIKSLPKKEHIEALSGVKS